MRLLTRDAMDIIRKERRLKECLLSISHYFSHCLKEELPDPEERLMLMTVSCSGAGASVALHGLRRVGPFVCTSQASPYYVSRPIVPDKEYALQCLKKKPTILAEYQEALKIEEELLRLRLTKT